MKRCANCDQEKPAESFSFDRYQGDQLSNWCDPCQGKPVTVHLDNTEADFKPDKPPSKPRTTRKPKTDDTTD